MARVWNRRDPNCPKDAVYIGRPGKWGNPYKIGVDYLLHDGRHTGKLTRAQALDLYRPWLARQLESGKLDIAELAGKDLACWCKPLDCHGDILLSYVTGSNENGKVAP